MQICEKLPDFCAAKAFCAVAPDAKKRSKRKVWTQTSFSTAKNESEPVPAAVSCAGAASVPGTAARERLHHCVWDTLVFCHAL